MSPGRDLGSGRGSGTPCPLLPVRRPERDWPAISRGYRIAVEGHRWRPADEQEPSRLTRIAVDRGVEPQTVRVISAPLILDGPGRPGSPPLPPHANCPHTPPHPGPAPPQPTAPARRFPDRHRHGRGHSARPGASLCGQGHSTPSETAIPSPHARDAPGWKKVSPHTQNVPRHASELSVTRRTLVASDASRLPLSRWHRCPRMATDSTTTADTTVIRAALQTIVTIGDSR